MQVPNLLSTIIVRSVLSVAHLYSRPCVDQLLLIFSFFSACAAINEVFGRQVQMMTYVSHVLHVSAARART